MPYHQEFLNDNSLINLNLIFAITLYFSMFVCSSDYLSFAFMDIIILVLKKTISDTTWIFIIYRVLISIGCISIIIFWCRSANLFLYRLKNFVKKLQWYSTNISPKYKFLGGFQITYTIQLVYPFYCKVQGFFFFHSLNTKCMI